MTRSYEKGESEITAAAKRESLRTGEPVETILARWLAEAKKAKNKARAQKIVRAQKFVRDRNRDKRRRDKRRG